MRALVADDDPGTALVLQKILEGKGLDVIVAPDGCAALDILKADPTIALAVFDWMMPGIDGPELCRRVRKDDTGNAMYVLLLTARDKTSDLVEGLDAAPMITSPNRSTSTNFAPGSPSDCGCSRCKVV